MVTSTNAPAGGLVLRTYPSRARCQDGARLSNGMNGIHVECVGNPGWMNDRAESLIASTDPDAHVVSGLS
jgi:hypothetical protein